MKKTLMMAYLALFLCFLLPLTGRDRPAPPQTTPEPTASAPPASQDAPPPVETPAPVAAAFDPAPETIRVLMGEQVTEKDMQDYLIGVVAAEMPASFPLEALKAQAVAARSYAMYCAAAHKHGDADVCTDFACCQAWQEDGALREKWGGDYDANLAKIRQAVEETAGEYLSYEGVPVFAAFHSSSAGATEDSGQVWNPCPYLVSVDSPETAEAVPGYVSGLDCSALDFRDTVLSAHPEADFTGPEAAWLGELTRDDSGRVSTLTVGGVSLRGTELRRLFSLRSTAFTLEYADGRFLFTVTGNGHGVGMSQYGAKVLAEGGTDYRQILAHYYPGTALAA